MSKIAGSFVIAVVLFTMPSFADEDVACKTNWGYDEKNGPARWGQLEPAYAVCDEGQFQAPVALGTGTSSQELLTVNYSAARAVTIQHTAHAMNVFALGENANRMNVGTITAFLQKFHFHIQPEHPSAPAVAELHLVNLTTAGKAYVIAVLIDADAATPNAAIASLITSFPTSECTSVKLNTFPLQSLVPANTTQWTRYTGSLTTPPCSPDVTFFVLKNHLHITPAQFESLKPLAEGVRPPQPPNGRAFIVRQ
jgi:carbonic anhydrase